MDRPRQCLDHLCRRAHGLGLALEMLSEAAAGHVLKDKVRASRGLADIVNLHDVGMLQARKRRGLGAKAGQVLGACLNPLQNHLQRHGALEPELPGLVNHPHAASSQFPQDFVAGHSRPIRSPPPEAELDASGESASGLASGNGWAAATEANRFKRCMTLLRLASPRAVARRAPQNLRIGGAGQAGQMFLARGASFHMPHEGVPVIRAQRISQQVRKKLVERTDGHEHAPGPLRERTDARWHRHWLRPDRRGPRGGSMTAGHWKAAYKPTSSLPISSWSIFCTLLLAT